MDKGKIGYFPKIVIKELEDIKMEYNLNKDGDALRLMANRSMAYRELKFNLGGKKKR